MTARTEYLQTVVQLDYGSLTNPTSLLNLISHLRRIRSESSTRHDFIGNWLNCLRDHSVELLGNENLQAWTTTSR